jgi:alpha-ribazole phosphatase
MRLWLARHAAVTCEQGLCYGRLDIAADDALTQEAAVLLHRTVPIDAIVRCSPARRCRQLAESLATLRPSLPISFESDIQEMDFGSWEGRPWAGIGEAALAAWTADFAQHRPGGGESVSMLLQRVSRALERDGTAREVVWITHAGVIRAARLLLSGIREPRDAGEWPRDDVPFGAVECHSVPD